MVQTTTATSEVNDYFFVVKSANVKTSSRGDRYLDMVLANAKEEIPAKLWDYKENTYEWLTSGMIVKVRGNEELWNDKKQFRVQRIRRVGPEDRLNMREIVPCAPYDGEDMFQKLYEKIESFQDEDLRKLTQAMFNREHEKLILCPAAVRLHHAMCGGLLYHTMTVAELCEGVCKVYPFVNRDLLLTGAILHDLSKMDELCVEETGIASGYTVRGELIGHLVMGAIEVEKVALELNISEEKRTLVQHMLISHHGIPEYGCAVRPAFLEAELLSMLDNMDAEVNQITAATETVEEGGFSAKLWARDQRKFYRPHQN